MNKNFKMDIMVNLIWRFAERVGAQVVTLVVSIILARLLNPEVYGTIALVTVFTTILQVFVDSGLGNALIQKKEADDLDFSSVFYFNLFMCFILYLLMFIFAPLIAAFYNQPELKAIVRVISLSIILSGIKNVQQAYVSRNMLFKRFFFATLGGTIGAAVIGIWMAYNGYGVWALIAQSLFNQTVDTLILWITVKWRPKRLFSVQRLKALLSYGWKLFASSLLDTIYNQLRALIIGKMYTAQDLAFYNKGNTWPNLITVNINSSIDSVLFPAMSSIQDDVEKIRSMTRRAIKTSSYIMMPIMIGLAVCVEPLVSLLLTDKWMPIVPYMRIFCFTYAFYPIHTANLNALKALGRSDIFLKLEVIKKIVGVIAVLATMWFGVWPMACSLLVTSVISQIVNSWPNRKLLNYSYIQQLLDILPEMILAGIMGLIIWFVQYLPIPNYLILIIQVVGGALIYLFGSYVFKFDSFNYLYQMIKRGKSSRKE